MDLIVPGLNVSFGQPLFCDITCVSPITGRGFARPGCLLRDGGALRRAQRDNNRNYPEVVSSGLGRLCCLSVEVFGRWGDDCIELVPALARERVRGLPARVRRGAELALRRRWWGLLGLAVQHAVIQAVTRDEGEDLNDDLLERIPLLADLPVD